MSFMDRARQAAEQARQAANTTIGQATGPEAQEQWRQTGAQVKEAAGTARRNLVTAIEKIDPGLLADVVIKATAIQEKANMALRAKGAAYRIGEITITATIPPQIGFAIVRVGDLDEPVPGQVESGDLVESVGTAEEQVVSLEGDVAPIEEDLAALPEAPPAGLRDEGAGSP
jgi:hypothetical protein